MAAIVSLTMWKGETRGLRVSNAVGVGTVPAGIEARIGTLTAAQYEPRPGGRQIATAYDRVDFGQGAGGRGPKFLSVRVARRRSWGRQRVKGV